MTTDIKESLREALMEVIATYDPEYYDQSDEGVNKVDDLIEDIALFQKEVISYAMAERDRDEALDIAQGKQNKL